MFLDFDYDIAISGEYGNRIVA